MNQDLHFNTLSRQFRGTFILRSTLRPSKSRWTVAGARYLKCSEPQQVVRETKLVQQELDFLWKFPAPKSHRAFQQNSDNMLLPGCVAGERRWVDGPLVLTRCQVQRAPQGLPRQHQRPRRLASPPPPRVTGLVLVLSVLSLRAPFSRWLW